MKKYDDRLKDAPEWQVERFKEMTDKLNVELTDDEKRYLLWLSGCDIETKDVFTGLFVKLQTKN